MESVSKRQSRTFDYVALAILACLFIKGFVIAMQPGHYGDFRIVQLFYSYYLEMSVLSMISFVAVFHSFRVHTRALWVIAAPLFAAVMPVFGNDIYMQLNRAPGEEAHELVKNPADLFIFYLGFLICWSLFHRFGFRLRGEGRETLREHMSLSELMAITAVVATLLLAYRDTVQPSQLHWGNLLGGNWADGREMLISIVGIFAIFGGLKVGLLVRRRRWTVLALGLSAAALCFICWWYNSHRLLFDAMNGTIHPLDVLVIYSRFLIVFVLPVGITSGACLVARRAGFRLTRRFQAREKLAAEVDPQVAAVS